MGNAYPLLEPLMPDPWLAAFHAGQRAAIEGCYRDHFPVVSAAVARVLPPADAETVTHEVFYRLLSDVNLRANFQGGNLGAWLARVATNSALDFRRRRKWEQSHGDESNLESPAAPDAADALEAKRLVERFRRECLPPKWAAVFEARFLRQLPQRAAAEELGMSRTTLVYQELRVRKLLTRFLLRAERP